MVDVPKYFYMYLNSQHNLTFLHSFKLESIVIDLPTQILNSITYLVEKLVWTG